VPSTAPGGDASDGDLKQWASQCSDLGVGGVAIEGVGRRERAAASRRVLVDRRGNFTYCVDISAGSGTASDPLIALSGIRDGELQGSWVTTTDRPFQSPRGSDALVLGGDLRTPPPEPNEPGVISLKAFQAYGLAGPDVTGIAVTLTNGLRVTATLDHGIWGLWWPQDRGDPTGSLLEIQTATGSRTIPASSVQLTI
jgi:hypothetical protein